VANQDMMLEFIARNNESLTALVEEHSVEVRTFPADVLDRLRSLSERVVADVVGDDPLGLEIYESYQSFLAKSKQWHDLSERAFLNIRAE